MPQHSQHCVILFYQPNLQGKVHDFMVGYKNIP